LVNHSLVGAVRWRSYSQPSGPRIVPRFAATENVFRYTTRRTVKTDGPKPVLLGHAAMQLVAARTGPTTRALDRMVADRRA